MQGRCTCSIHCPLGRRNAPLQLRRGVIPTAGGPDSVRMQAAKFTEQLVLLLTAPTAPPPPAGAAASAGVEHSVKARLWQENTALVG